ncbi:hypothetical protein HPP92_006731 [Vanilla planifolia]|uniref:Uncharacterized protein n=1 Tax=Vanilla planifolia TaxID=51239 RepID=A0A835RGV5_VANPL|nr:hypothetical protein HPP92_006731 [Vanilla planifolia]
MSACWHSSPEAAFGCHRQLWGRRRRQITVNFSAAVRSQQLPPASAGGLVLFEAAVLRCSGRKWERRKGQERGREIAAVRSKAVGERTGNLEEGEEEEEERRRAAVVAAAAMTAFLGTGNRVLYKLALVPLKQYPFFLAQLATFGYVVVYFSILCCRYHAGIVTDEMLSMPKAPLMAVGFLEALGAASGMAAGDISGVATHIIIHSSGRRYRANQVFGCVLVSIGVIITVTSGSDSGLSLQNVGIFWILLMIGSFFLQAADTVLKEIIFLDAAKRLKLVELNIQRN